MPYCPNCGKQVGAEHHYCGECGYPLAEITDEENEMVPPGTAAARLGFLSGRSIEYIHRVTVEGEEIDPETVGY